MLRIYGMSDIHLGIPNDKMESIFEANFENCVKTISENGVDNIILIAGDLFDKPAVRNEVSDSFLRIVNKYKKNVKFMVSAGNHDSSPIRKSTLDIFESLMSMSATPVCNSENIKGLVFNKYSEIPSLIVSVDKFTRVIVDEEQLIIDLLPYCKNLLKLKMDKNEKALLTRDGYRSFLSCHGVTEKGTIYSNDDVIHYSYFVKRDYVLKGHIHQIYDEEMKGSFIFSAGSLNNNSSRSEGCYVYIYNNENSSESGQSDDAKVGTIINQTIDILEEHKVTYKIFNNENPSTINETLKTLGKNDVVSILYSGDQDMIDEDEYMRCFKVCLKFTIHPKEIDLEVDNYTSRSINEQEFINFFDFMNDTLNKMSNDSDIEILRKTYNKSICNFTQRLGRS